MRRLVCACVVRKPRRQVFSRRGPIIGMQWSLLFGDTKWFNAYPKFQFIQTWLRKGCYYGCPGGHLGYWNNAILTILDRHVSMMHQINVRCNLTRQAHKLKSRGREFDPGPVPYFRVDWLNWDWMIDWIISTVILLPSADSFKKGCCQLQAKVCAEEVLVNWGSTVAQW